MHPDIVYAHSSKAGAIARVADIGLKNHCLYNPHGWAFNMRCSAKKKAMYTAIEKIAAPFCDKIICISDAEKQSALDKKICREDKLQVIFNKELLHIGDATRSDFLIPIEKGIHAKKISKRNRIRTKQEYYYQLGFSLFGVLVYEFCRWIHDQKDNKNLIFLAREGVFLSECYHELFPEDQFEILYVFKETGI